MPKYKWSHPYEWLADYLRDKDSAFLYQAAMQLAEKLDGDTIQDLFSARDG